LTRDLTAAGGENRIKACGDSTAAKTSLPDSAVHRTLTGASTFMGKHHAPGFLQIVQDAKTRIVETTVPEIRARMERGEDFHLIDVREESEYAAGRIPGAVHMGKGVIERDIEGHIANHDAEIVLYCGGGYRSALAADNLQKMGYTRVLSMDGGFRGWTEAGLPIER